MAGIAELNKTEEDIKSKIAETEKLTEQPIPERTYNSGITKEIQGEYIKQKIEAQTYLSQLREYYGKVEEAKAQETQRINAINEYNREVEAREMALREWKLGMSPYWFKGKPEYKYLVELWENGAAQQVQAKNYENYKEKYGSYPNQEQPIQLPEGYYKIEKGMSVNPNTIPQEVRNKIENSQVIYASNPNQLKRDINTITYIDKKGNEIDFTLMTRDEFIRKNFAPQKFDLTNIPQLAVQQEKNIPKKEIRHLPLFSKETPIEYSRAGMAGQTYYLISNAIREQGAAMKATAKEAIASIYVSSLYYKEKSLYPRRTLFEPKINYPLTFAKIENLATSTQQKHALVNAGLITGSVSPASPLVTSYFIYETAKSGINLYRKRTPQTLASFTMNLPLVFGLTKRAGKVAFEKVEIGRDVPIAPEIKSETLIYNIRKGEKQIDVASFVIVGTKAPRYSYVTPRVESFIGRLSEKLNGKTPKTYNSLNEIRINYPSAERLVIEKPKVSVALTEPFIVSKGTIVGSLRNPKSEVFVISAKNTNKTLTLSTIKGSLREGAKSLRTINMNKLDPLTKKAFERISTIKNQNGIKVTHNFPKETLLQKGDIILKDLYKINSSGLIKLKPYGRRLTRSDITSVQESKANIEFEKEYGLKEYEELKDYLGIIDVTRPRVPRTKNTNKILLENTEMGILLTNKKSISNVSPKKSDLLTGKTIRKYYELPSESEPVNFIKGAGNKRTPRQEQKLMQELYKNNNVISKLRAGAAVKVTKTLSPRPVSVKQALNLKEGYNYPLLGIPKYVGGEGVFTNNIILESEGLKEIPSESESFFVHPREIEKINLKELQSNVQKNVQRNIQKDILRDLQKPMTKEIQKPLLKEIQRYIQKETPKLIQRPVTKQPTKPNLSPPSKPPTIKKETNMPPAISRGKKNNPELKTTKGYLTFVKRFNKIRMLPGIRTKEEALILGEKEAKDTLAATFGIKESNEYLKAENNKRSFRISNLFRNYRIRKGKREYMRNIFIQKLGKRLSSRSEVSEIQNARRIFK